MSSNAARLLAFAFLLAALPLSLAAQNHKPSTPEYTFKVIRAYPHDPQAFTQGLAYRDGFLYEGTGLHGRSSLRKVRLETGEVLQKIDLPQELFGEGIAFHKNEIIQITWVSNIGFVYDASDFHFLRRFSYKGEGWGLATDATLGTNELFMSDGTSEIRVLDANALAEKRRFTVRDGDKPIDQLNELEFVEGELFANIWQTDKIARISPQTGKVLGWINLKGLLSPMYKLEPGEVLNGIAYDPIHKRLFVTGKLWPSLFEIRLLPKRHTSWAVQSDRLRQFPDHLATLHAPT
jgi:glutamine cyclotransferase